VEAEVGGRGRGGSLCEMFKIGKEWFQLNGVTCMLRRGGKCVCFVFSPPKNKKKLKKNEILN